ncbi:putative membrane protein YgcG [Algoriphagus iocasae]|uniref:Putative membrane protein YgcG n=1 Tax=Algoriphagus iocasae TaxID=1836499 RepID=A0A841MAQ3_9BACT|nr:hypothetical protein [Algoriphagus iocasae]MBB6325062.1 putative membrane protein YgcG [Algoriphagus iocasae]
MRKISIFTSSVVLSALALSACSTNKLATSGEQDNLYFMASDAKIATEFAVQNNNPESFESLSSLNTDSYKGENFSSRNVNPEYIARYTAAEDTISDEMVYFDEGVESSGEGDINAYDNYRVNNSNSSYGSNFFPTMSLSLGYMGGFSPWGMGYYSPFYDPFYMPGYMYPSFGFRPGFSLGFGFGFGFGLGFGSMWGPSYAWGGYPMYGGFYPSYGYPGYYPGYGFNRPIYVLPGGEYGDRRVVRGARATRGSSLATSSLGTRSSAVLPSTSRAQARREAVNSPSNRSLVSNSSARTASREFGSSKNDYYTNSRSRVGTTRNVSSPAVTRSATRSRSAMPSARPSYSGTNSRSSNSVYRPSRNTGTYNRSASPSYNRSASPSYNRSNIPARTSPSYGSPSRSSMPSRSNTPSYSAPSRSSGSGMSSGGSRSGGGSVSSGSSRGGRGN